MRRESKLLILKAEVIEMKESIVPQELIENRIFLFRGEKVMLDKDLARLYGVKTKIINQAVKRNRSRFPEDFMFQLSKEEAQLVLQITTPSSRSQIVTLKKGQNIKYLPYAFTEQGIAMLSSVLKSERAVQINILIMRIFVNLRRILATHKELADKLKELEQRVGSHDSNIRDIFSAIKKIMFPPPKKRRKIGFI
jgi:hypothetical protein